MVTKGQVQKRLIDKFCFFTHFEIDNIAWAVNFLNKTKIYTKFDYFFFNYELGVPSFFSKLPKFGMTFLLGVFTVAGLNILIVVTTTTIVAVHKIRNKSILHFLFGQSTEFNSLFDYNVILCHQRRTNFDWINERSKASLYIFNV